MSLQRLRITFEKTEAMKYTGHLDLHQAWERLIRRARLPLAYTQGFSPHPRINLASALPLGFTGQAEVIDIWLEAELPVDEILAALRSASPPGIQIRELEAVELHLAALQSVLEASEYVITLLEPVADIEERIQQLLASPTLARERRGKPYDLRPLILGLERIADDPIGLARLLACLAAREGATGRPEEVLAAMGIDPLTARMHRTRLIFQGQAGPEENKDLLFQHKL
jgi:radical SAM-linked protein